MSENKKIRVIINADDLGYNLEINRQIENGIRKGVITSSTLMANAPGFEDGVRIAKQYNQISVGIHLNLVEYTPLTNYEIFKKNGIVGDDGSFINGAIFVTPINDELKQAIYEEWDAQISRMENSGLIPTHADSHQHTHTIMELQDVLCGILKKHKIAKVRRKIVPSLRKMIWGSKNIKVVIDKKNAVQPPKRNVIYRRWHLIVVKLQGWQWNTAMSKHFIMSNQFYSFRDFYSNRSLLRLGGKNTVIELMCHPGQKAFQQETEILIQDKSWLPYDYQLINYNQL